MHTHTHMHVCAPGQYLISGVLLLAFTSKAAREAGAGVCIRACLCACIRVRIPPTAHISTPFSRLLRAAAAFMCLLSRLFPDSNFKWAARASFDFVSGYARLHASCPRGFIFSDRGFVCCWRWRAGGGGGLVNVLRCD